MKSKKASGFGFEAQLSITGKGRYAAAYGLSCKKDYNGLHATAPRRTIPYPNTRPATAPSPKPPNSLTATKAPSAAKSSGTVPKGGNTAPKKPNGKAGLPNGVSGNPISSNGSTRTGGRVSDRAGIKNAPITGKDQKSALSALVERVTRHTIICKLKNLKAEALPRQPLGH